MVMTQTPIHTLKSTQQETDTWVILYGKYTQYNGYQYACTRSPDTDVFFIILYFGLELKEFILLFNSSDKLINLSDLASDDTQEHCSALLGLHTFTKCDSTSAFKGICNVKPIKSMQKSPKFVKVLTSLGDLQEVCDELMTNLEEFTCALYGWPYKIKDVNSLHYQLLMQSVVLMGK